MKTSFYLFLLLCWDIFHALLLYLIQSIQKHNTGIRTFQSLRGGYILLDYIWLDDKSPILEQLPRNF